jgi:hypothetical protein
MSGCQHKEMQTLRSGSTYCVDCGMQMVTLPPIRYEEALRDGRQQNWLTLDERLQAGVEFHKTYIGALYDKTEGCWRIGRVVWCDDCGQFEVAQSRGLWQRTHQAAPITHVSEDVLGTPRAIL